MQYWLANKAPNAADTNNTCNNLSAVGARPRSSARVSYVFLPLSTYSSVFPSRLISIPVFLRLSLCLFLAVTSSFTSLSISHYRVPPDLHTYFHPSPSISDQRLSAYLRLYVSMSHRNFRSYPSPGSLRPLFSVYLRIFVPFPPSFIPSTRPSWRSEISLERVSFSSSDRSDGAWHPTCLQINFPPAVSSSRLPTSIDRNKATSIRDIEIIRVMRKSIASSSSQLVRPSVQPTDRPQGSGLASASPPPQSMATPPTAAPP